MAEAGNLATRLDIPHARGAVPGCSGDMPAVRRIMHQAQGDRYRFTDLVLGIVRSEPFLMRARDNDSDRRKAG